MRYRRDVVGRKKTGSPRRMLSINIFDVLVAGPRLIYCPLAADDCVRAHLFAVSVGAE